jgi:hypothetical protein
MPLLEFLPLIRATAARAFSHLSRPARDEAIDDVVADSAAGFARLAERGKAHFWYIPALKGVMALPENGDRPQSVGDGGPWPTLHLGCSGHFRATPARPKEHGQQTRKQCQAQGDAPHLIFRRDVHYEQERSEQESHLLHLRLCRATRGRA